MNGNDDELFLQEMADVTPLSREPRVHRRGKGGPDRDNSLAQRRAAAVTERHADANPLTDTAVAPLDAWYILDFKRPGVQNGVYRKLKQGRYEPQARLDLHRMNVERARREIYEFIQESHRLGLRCVQLIHGKGQGAAEQERCSILKGGVDHWLREIEIVQAFHSAQPRHGGTGAAYVLLRKSEEKKQETRDHFAKGRVPVD